MATYQFFKEQVLNASMEQLWDFISSPANLKKITPSYMGFDITTKYLPEKMYQGMMISYKVSPVPGFKSNWLTEITHVEPGKYFVDEQRSGPYKIWHHEHKLIPAKKGVLMTDLITYEPPFGILGRVANALLIENKLEEIFAYRRNKLIDLFGEVTD
ncbi:MAG: SRPBCC family protein [Cyclobacteriaceae bacterium]